MTMVETPTAAMKILWSRSQQPCSSQLTAILWSPPQIYSSALRLEFGGSEDVQEEERSTSAANGNCPGLWLWLGRTGNVRGCGRRNREREREMGGRVCPRRVWAERF
jgi:hypothetical protein